MRAYATVASRMDEAGYSAEEAEEIRRKVRFYSDVRDEVKLGAGENLDLKQFEAGMRRLLDTYVVAEESRELESFDRGLVQLLAERGEDGLATLPSSLRNNREAISDTIENNIRTTIVDEQAMNPKYYDQLSKLLDDLIEKRRQEVVAYEEYLKQMVGLARAVSDGTDAQTAYPTWADTTARRAFVDFHWPDSISIELEGLYKVIQDTKEHGWASSIPKRKALKNSILRNTEASLAPELVDELLDLLERHDEFQ